MDWLEFTGSAVTSLLKRENKYLILVSLDLESKIKFSNQHLFGTIKPDGTVWFKRTDAKPPIISGGGIYRGRIPKGSKLKIEVSTSLTNIALSHELERITVFKLGPKDSYHNPDRFLTTDEMLDDD